MVLSDQERIDVAAAFMRNPGGKFGTLTKQDIFAACDALDGFFASGGNVVDAKAAIPKGAKALTDAQISTLATLLDLKRNPPPPPDPVPDARIADVAGVLVDMGADKTKAADLAERLLKALGV